MTYLSLISTENLFQAWEEFKVGKRNRRDVQFFERHLEDNLFKLHHKLKTKTYEHGDYFEFYVNDPKRRHIHKAHVVDRIVHHLLYKYLYQVFDKTFIYDSYSCRLNKGTHKAVKRLESFSRKLSKNYTQNFWVLRCDIKKFFESIDHEILIDLLKGKIKNENILWLLRGVINGFEKGIPLGNLTSQIFANIYLNELDLFVKHKLRIRYYLRYADDFILLDSSEAFLYQCINTLKQFLIDILKLEIHPNKIILRKLSWGIDFAGYIVLPYYRLPRTKTKKRIFKKVLKSLISEQSLQSYLGYFSHALSYHLRQELKNLFFLGSN